jgi:hypothetical protein
VFDSGHVPDIGKLNTQRFCFPPKHCAHDVFSHPDSVHSNEREAPASGDMDQPREPMAKKHSHGPAAKQRALEAQRRQDFNTALHEIFEALDCGRLLTLLPKAQREFLYACRPPSLRFEAAPGETIRKKAFDFAKDCVYFLLKRATITPGCNDAKVSWYAMFRYGLTLAVRFKNWDDEEFSDARILKEALGRLKPSEEIYNDLILELFNTMRSAGVMMSDLSTQLYWLEVFSDINDDDYPRIVLTVRMHAHNPEKIDVSFHNIPRKALRVAQASEQSGVEYAGIRPSQMGLHASDDDPRPVYIQNHALKRLQERLAPVSEQIVQRCLFLSLSDVRNCRRGDGCLLIEYRFGKVKAGYLVADAVDNMIIIRTFLFLTNEGSPEGNKLMKLCGLSRLDAEYLNLDRLQPFLMADIDMNDDLFAIFHDAGCGGLLTLHDPLGQILPDPSAQAPIELWARYLGLDRHSHSEIDSSAPLVSPLKDGSS